MKDTANYRRPPPHTYRYRVCCVDWPRAHVDILTACLETEQQITRRAFRYMAHIEDREWLELVELGYGAPKGLPAEKTDAYSEPRARNGHGPLWGPKAAHPIMRDPYVKYYQALLVGPYPKEKPQWQPDPTSKTGSTRPLFVKGDGREFRFVHFIRWSAIEFFFIPEGAHAWLQPEGSQYAKAKSAIP